MYSVESYFCKLIFEIESFKDQIAKGGIEKDVAMNHLSNLPKKMLEEMDSHGITSEEFWECSCADKFLHNVSESTCQVCGDCNEDSPDALMSGVVEKYIQENKKG